MWWAEQSSYRNAFEVAEAISSFQRYFADDDGEASRPHWLRGVGALPLHRSQQWATVVYLDRSLDPRRTQLGGPLGPLFTALYDWLGPIERTPTEPGFEDSLDTGFLDRRRTDRRRGTPGDLVDIARFAARRWAHPSRFVLPFDYDADVLWQRLLLQLDVQFPTPTVAYFIGPVKPTALRVRSLGARDFGSIGCILDTPDGHRFCTTAGHAVDPGQVARIRRARAWPRGANRATVREHHAPNLRNDSLDLALLETALPVDAESDPLTVMHGSALEVAKIRAQYSGASLKGRTLCLYATTTPLIDDSGTRRWIGYVANTGDRRRVAAGGDSGAAVIDITESELVGHLMASTHSHGAIVQSAQHEVDGLQVAGPLSVRMPKEWL